MYLAGLTIVPVCKELGVHKNKKKKSKNNSYLSNTVNYSCLDENSIHCCL